MNFFNRVLQKLKDSKTKKEEERYRLQQIRNDASEMERIEFEKQKKIQLRDYAIKLARQEIEMKKGMAKLRAERKLRYLEEQPLNFSENKLDKFREYRLRNLERTAKNYQRAAEMKQGIKGQKLLKLQDVQARKEFANQQRQFKMQNLNQFRRMPFEPRGWGR